MKPKAFIISLKRAKDRREHAIAQAEKAGLDFEVIEAVDARAFKDSDGNVDWDALRRVQPFTNDNWGATLKASEVAIYASHLKCYQRMLNLDLEWAFVCEDDFQLREAPYSLLDVANELDLSCDQWSHALLHHEHLHFNSKYRVMGPFQGFKTLNRVRQTALIGVASAISAPFARYFLSEHSVMSAPVDHAICAASEDPCSIFLQTSFPVCGSSGMPSTQE